LGNGSGSEKAVVIEPCPIHGVTTVLRVMEYKYESLKLRRETRLARIHGGDIGDVV